MKGEQIALNPSSKIQIPRNYITAIGY